MRWCGGTFHSSCFLSPRAHRRQARGGRARSHCGDVRCAADRLRSHTGRIETTFHSALPVPPGRLSSRRLVPVGSTDTSFDPVQVIEETPVSSRHALRRVSTRSHSSPTICPLLVALRPPEGAGRRGLAARSSLQRVPGHGGHIRLAEVLGSGSGRPQGLPARPRPPVPAGSHLVGDTVVLVQLPHNDLLSGPAAEVPSRQRSVDRFNSTVRGEGGSELAARTGSPFHDALRAGSTQAVGSADGRPTVSATVREQGAEELGRGRQPDLVHSPMTVSGDLGEMPRHASAQDYGPAPANWLGCGAVLPTTSLRLLRPAQLASSLSPRSCSPPAAR